MSVVEAGTKVDPEMLHSALAAANIPTLIPLLVQLTGDRKWMSDPYRPTRGQGTEDHDTGGLPEEIQAEIRAAVEQAVLAWGDGRPPAIPSPAGPELLELLELCVAEEVPPEYEAMSAENMGFRPHAAPVVDPDKAKDMHVLVIGAGISGLTAAKSLRDLGIRHTVLEKNDQVGGTWLENRYPGCGVDTPSYLYSLSFFPRAWSTHFSRRAELEQYLRDLTDSYQLTERIRFGMTVVSATWDADAAEWVVRARDRTGHEETLRATVLISAVGQLNVPRVPELPGLSSFAGPVFHSARWPEDLDISGKRVAVVGTGASAMQIVPAIADHVAELDVYQRSPQWVSPNGNYFREVGDAVHWLMDSVPYYRAWYRFRLAWMFNDRVHTSLQKDPHWPHADRSLNAINDAHRRFFTRYMLAKLDGRPDLIEKALPDYPPFGKRMLLDNGWFDAIRKDNVHLITSPVTSLTATGVVTAAGEEHPADIVVLATGFQAHRPVRYEVTGVGGRTLQDAWGDDDARAYLGITVPGFPNLFFMYGPNTNLGHGGSFIFLAESQITYILDALATMAQRGIASLECRPEVCDRYNAKLDAAHQQMVWTHPGMDTWYRNAKGRVVSTMPWRVVDYWMMTRSADLEDFIVVREDAVRTPAAS